MYDKRCLMHAGQRKNHKYIARVRSTNSNRWRYFYTQEEYQAYMNACRSKKEDVVAQELNEDGSIKKSERSTYRADGTKKYKTSEFEYKKGKETKMTRTVSEHTNSGSWISRTTEYRAQGRNFVDKLLGRKKSYWKEGNTSYSSGV